MRSRFPTCGSLAASVRRRTRPPTRRLTRRHDVVILANAGSHRRPRWSGGQDSLLRRIFFGTMRSAKALGIVTVAVLVVCPVLAGRIGGVLFEDPNRNGVLDAGEAPLA